MTKTILITSVSRGDVPSIEAGLRAQGYTTAVHSQNGRITVVGTKEVGCANEAVGTAASRSARKPPGTTGRRGGPKP